MDDYALLDSGNGRKLERFGPYTLARPAAQAAWRPRLGPEAWGRADASFDRSKGNSWTGRSALPETWDVSIAGVRFILSPTGFGHIGVFPEQCDTWLWMRERIRRFGGAAGRACRVLNLFAYSGGSTIAAAQGGAEVCHLDASRGMVERARENAARNGLADAPVRWVVDDAVKFLRREVRRGRLYDALILDPPSFGRGRRGEVFKIGDDIGALLDLCRDVLADEPLFLVLSCHTPEFSPRVLHNLVAALLRKGERAIDSGEMVLRGRAEVPPLPSGSYARWAAGGE